MTLLLNLPNGEQLDLLGNQFGDMEYICTIGGQFSEPITKLLAAYKQAASESERDAIAERIAEQSYYYANAIGAYDEELQQQIGIDDLAHTIYKSLLNHAKQ